MNRSDKWRVDLYQHTEYGAYDIVGPSEYFRTLRAARSWARNRVFHGDWHHAHIDKGAWGYEYAGQSDIVFILDDDHRGYDVWNDYAQPVKA